MKWSLFYVLAAVFFVYCSQTVPDHLEVVTYFPDELKENSGLEVLQGSELVWVINDSGNKDHLYGINTRGEIEKEFNVKGGDNKDWEDIAADSMGNIFIADIGNNSFQRNELIIYKVPNPIAETGEDLQAETIEFTYPGFEKDQPVNAEAMVYYQGNLYIFSKNEHKSEDGITRVYAIPAVAGKHTATLVTELPTCDDATSCRITAADISPDGKSIALLSYGKVWIGRNFLTPGTAPDLKVLELDHLSQKEGLCFYDNNTLFLADERNHHGGGALYRFRLPK